ncbi:radical SAM protein [Sunxiuqinia sp. A32]|uniref:radical SAM protein n=1 Tax=Sunxiuqinia sp. A32 TaxID=3461496 RepID=UPI0040455F03
MNNEKQQVFDGSWIVNQRGQKNPVDPYKPYAWLVEKELTAYGNVEDTGVIFLTSRECSYRCMMCDLWKNTTDGVVPKGAIPSQLKWALDQIAPVSHLKLYNSGSFFDRKAILVDDYGAIASLLKGFKNIIVESHANYIGDKCLRFQELLKTDLEVAIGLETVNENVLERLNKQMTLADFRKSIRFLKDHGIQTRTFILLKPPFMSEKEGVYWAKKSLEFAFEAGVGCCTIIPVRPGNGAMDRLMEIGHFSPPTIESLEEVLDYGISLNAGRVFADTWDLKLFSTCDKCLEKRIDRITKINLHQRIAEPVSCNCLTT